MKLSNKNKLSLNISKCATMTFTRKKNVLKYTYTVNEEELCHLTTVRDLGINLDVGLTFKYHTNTVLAKARRMAYFVVRNSVHFKRISTLKVLYFSFIRSILEFGVLIWFPHTKKFVKELEKIQNRFLKYLYFKTFEYYPHDLSQKELLEGFEVELLVKRREITALMFLYDLIHCNVRDSNLLAKINFWAPKIHSRQKKIFSLHNYNTSRMKVSPMNNIMGISDAFLCRCADADIYSMGRSAFKRVVGKAWEWERGCSRSCL